MAGPTSFAPIIEMATSIVEQSNGQYHVLLIIADGQVIHNIFYTSYKITSVYIAYGRRELGILMTQS